MKLNILPKKDQITNDWTVEKVAQEYPPPTWESVFENAKDEIKDISEILEDDKKSYGMWFPDNVNLFRAFQVTPLNKVRVVILGMDPYINTFTLNGKEIPQATGMAFSVPRGCPVPPSLKNIYKELANEFEDFVTPNHGDLTLWCLQGVMLLNVCLTVRKSSSGSHGEVWTGFIKKVINAILEANPHCIFVMWGKNAQKMKKIVGERTVILESAHPSPLSARNFFGCGHFKKINELLVERKQKPIDWSL